MCRKLILTLSAFCAVYFSPFLGAQQFFRFGAEHRDLRWTTPIYNSFSETEGKSFVWFEGAQYDPSRNFLPYVFERKRLSGNQAVTVRLENAVYEIMDPNSVAAIGTQANQIKPEAEITSYVTNSREEYFANIRIVPIRRNSVSGQLEKLVSYDLRVTTQPARRAPVMQRASATTSVLASGTWYRIAVAANGVYKIDYNFLNALGIDMSTLDPRNIRIYGNGRGQLSYNNFVAHADDLREHDIFVQGESDGVFDQSDYVLFFGVSANTWKYDTTDARYHHHVHE